MPLGPRAGGIFSKRYAPTLAIERHRCKARIGRDFCRSKDDPPAAKPAILLLSLRWTFVAKRASQIILLKSRTDFRDPAEFWQPLVHGADGVFGRHSRRDAVLGNLVRNSNWLLGSRFCRSRCWCWLGYHNRIGNRLRNIDGFRAGLMSSNHARPH
jgi:hypothetical protein